MKGKKACYCVLCVAMFVMGGITMSSIQNPGEEKTGGSQAACHNILVQYLEDLLEISLEDYAETAEGRVTVREGEEDEFIIKVKVPAGYEETVLELMKENFFEEDMESDMCSNFLKSFYKEYGVADEWKYFFWCFRSGKYAKTIIPTILVSYNDGRMYLYFWM